MSLSPSELTGDGLQDSLFMRNQDRLYRFIREGKSFSGHERNCCFLNLGDGRFANISATSGMDFADDARGLAITDWDHDGDLDMWVTNRTGPRLRYLQNDVGQGDRVLQFRLVGKECNRDAIGARITLIGKGWKQIKTLRAGDGYLAQSSKWLHFAIPAGEQIDRMTIGWPGGRQQEVGPLALATRYVIVQGQPARELDRRATVRFAAAGPVTAKRTTSVLAKLKSPIPVPPIPFESPQGGAAKMQPTAGKHKVLVLWASWCLPCLQELQELASQQEELKNAHLEILAVSVDGMAGQPTARADANSAADRLKLPFKMGFATAKTLDRLQQIHNQCFGLHAPLPVPTSFIFDDRHRLVGLIKGRAKVEQLTDLARLGHRSEGQGTWIEDPKYDLAFMVSMLLEEGSLDTAVQFLEDFASDFHAGDRYATVVAQVGTRLVAAKRFGEAERYFQTATDLMPDNAEWQNDLGTTKHLIGKTAEALTHFRTAAEMAPGNVEIQRNLVSVLISRGESVAAVTSLKAAIQKRPKNVAIRTMLADALRQSGEINEAIVQYRQVLDVEPDNVVVVQNLGATLLATRNIPAAIPFLEQATRLKPNDAGTFKNLGLAYAVTGKREQAIEKLQTSLRLAPDDAVVHNNLAGLLAQSGNLQMALPHFQRAVDLVPNNPTYRRNLADAKRARNRE